MQIGVVPAPLEWAHWEAAKAYLEPARKMGGFASVWEPDELLWAVMDQGECIACATAWMGDGFAEVKLVGGRDHRRWLGELNDRLGACAREAGALRLQAFGRSGWRKALAGLGWDVKGEADGMTIYHRDLGE